MVNEYEVEVLIKNRRSGESQSLTCTEYAYAISEVPTQVIYAVMRDKNIEDWEFRITRLGPPKRLVELAAKQVQSNIDTLLSTLSQAVKRK